MASEIEKLIEEGRKASATVDNYQGKNYLIRRLTDALEDVHCSGPFTAFQSTIDPGVWYVGDEKVAYLRTEIGVGNAERNAKLAADGLNRAAAVSPDMDGLPETRTPTVEEWYGGRQPTFPDDDGEEMRRISTRVPARPVPTEEVSNILAAGRKCYDEIQNWWTGDGTEPNAANLQEYIARSSLKLNTLSAALSAHTGDGVKVKALEWREYTALGSGRKLVAHNCFGDEFARIDLVGLSHSQIEMFKHRKQVAYERGIRSALQGAK